MVRFACTSWDSECMNSISIVIPAYNEEKRIQKTLDAYWSFFSKKKVDFEIIVVANNCSDQTAQIVLSFSMDKKNVRLLDIPRKIGKGGAVKAGFKLAQKSLIGFTDADNATPPREFFKVYSAASQADIAIGSRAVVGSVVIGQPVFRRFLGAGFRFLVNSLFGLNVRDTQCGAKVFSASAAKVVPTVQSHFFEFDVEVLWRAKQKGFSILEVPITWTDSPQSTVGFDAVPKMFIGLLRMRLRNI